MRKQLRSGWRSPSLRERVFEGMKACLESGDLCTSRDLYSLVIKSGLDSVGIVADHLIRLFAFGSSLLEALFVFSHVHQPSLYTWNIIISAHIQLGHPQGALALYGSMPISPDQITLSCVLKASINSDDIQAGRQAHTQITLHGIPLDFVVSGTLVHLYAKLGTLEEAARVFDCLSCRDVISWGAIIEGFLEKGEFYHALCYLRRMYQHGVSPNKVVLLLGLRACKSVAAARYGRPIHAEVCKLGFEKDTMLQSALVEMYSKCEVLEEVESIFHRADHVDLVLWSSILGAYVHSSKHELAFETYKRMVAGSIPPDRVIFLFLLQTCGSAENISEGFYVHKEMAMRGLDKGIVAENALISMYNKCGDLRQANQIFHGMQFRDKVSWNVIITGHINCGRYNEGLELFGNMQLEGVLPNVSVLSSILIACGNSLAMEEGHLIHQYILRYNLDDDLCINNGLVHMYSSLGMLKDSQIIFDKIMEKTICSWSSMILGFAEQGRVHDVLNLLAAMQQEGLLPDKGVIMCGLSACGLAGALADGNCVCHSALNYGFDLDLRLACEMVGMYVDCGTLKDAEAVFDQVEKPDVALWSSLIAGFCEFGEVSCAIRSVGEMLNAGLEPDDISYLGLLKLCCFRGRHALPFSNCPRWI